MAEIILKTNEPEKAKGILFEALGKELQRIQYSLSLAKKRIKRFEKKYDVSSEKFFAEWSAEDLEGQDLEYVEWAGEYQLSIKLNESLSAIKSIENVTQYQDREGNLIFRYDNAKHRPDLGYEAHKHLADGSISAAALPDIFDLVDEILGYLK